MASPKAQKLDKMLPWYQDNNMKTSIERVQTGVRIEKRILKVLKGLAEALDISLGDLIEGITLHCFEGKTPFGPETLEKIQQLKSVYGLDLTADHAHKLTEPGTEQ